MAALLIIQNDPNEGPGRLDGMFQKAGISTHRIFAKASEKVPRSIEGFDGLLILGGQQGVYEADQYPYLLDEIELCRDAVSRGVPVMGICLGAQVLATALGGTVAPGPAREIGWLPMELAPGAREDALFADHPQTAITFHFHGDQFTLPPGAVSLCRTEIAPHQAFRFGRSAYGFQYHPEVDAGLLEGMVLSNRDYVEGGGFDPDGIVAESPARLLEYARMYDPMLRRWVEMIGG